MQEKKIIFRYCIMSGYTTPTGQGTMPTAAEITTRLEEARRKAREIESRRRKKRGAELSGKNSKPAGGRRRKSRKRKSRRKSRRRMKGG